VNPFVAIAAVAIVVLLSLRFAIWFLVDTLKIEIAKEKASAKHWRGEHERERLKRVEAEAEANRIKSERFKADIDNAIAREREEKNEMDFPQLTLGTEQINEAISDYLAKRGLRIRINEEIDWGDDIDETEFYVTVPAELLVKSAYLTKAGDQEVSS
jgi:hypothetical protein